MKKNKISIIISFSIALILMYAILKKIGFEKLPEYLASINYTWIAAATMLYTVDMMVRAYRWQQILKDNSINIRLTDSFLAYNLGNAMNILIPAKIGDIARSYFLNKKYKLAYAKTLPATFVDRIFDVVGVYIVILICSVYVITTVKLDRWFYNMLLLGIIALVLTFVFLEVIINNKKLLKSIKNKRLVELIEAMRQVFHGSIKNKGKLLRMTVCSTFIWTCEGIITYFIFLSLGQNISPIIITFANMTANLTKIIPVTPGGLGVFEGTMILVLSFYGYTGAVIGIASTLNHLLMNLYTIALGMYALIRENIKIANIKMEKVNNQ